MLPWDCHCKKHTHKLTAWAKNHKTERSPTPGPYLGSWVRARWPCRGSLGLAGLMTGLRASSVKFPSQSFRSVTRMKRMSARTFSSRNLPPAHHLTSIPAL